MAAHLITWVLLLPGAHAQWQTVWRIGEDEDPFLRNYAPTDEFSIENGVNDPKPGTLYNRTTNPKADDDFYFAGLYPFGFNALTGAQTWSFR